MPLSDAGCVSIFPGGESTPVPTRTQTILGYVVYFVSKISAINYCPWQCLKIES
jgi:hypothetical protein